MMLEATIAVNESLAAMVPAAPSPDKIEDILEVVRQQDDLAVEELTLELGKRPSVIL